MVGRILHVAETTDGGVGRCLEYYVEHQAAAGRDVTVAVPRGGPRLERMSSAGAKHLAWEAMPQPGVHVPREIARLAEVVRAVAPDVVHLHSSKAGLAGRLLLRRSRPTVFQPHAWSFLAVTGATRSATLQWERLGARWADAIICCSEDERRIGAASRIRPREYRVVIHGLDLDTWPPMDGNAREQARGRLRVPPARPLAVCVGRLHRQKRQHALLDVWPAVRAEVPGARLALVGDGPDREELAAREVEGVDLVGGTGDVRTWLAAASLVVQPSLWEAGIPLSVLEALASCRGVVVTDAPGLRDVAGRGVGAVVTLDDARALRDAVVHRLRDPRKADFEGREGRRLIKDRHDVRTEIKAIDSVYREVVAG